MTGILTELYEPSDAEEWDAIVERSTNGTFLHTRRFLSYHGDRFADRSLVFKDEKGRVIGVLPAALDLEDNQRIVSHPGSTYGGVVHAGDLSGELLIEALQQAKVVYSKLGVKTLRYKAVPFIYHRIPAGDDLYALFRLGAQRYRCDLSATIDIANRPVLSERRRRDLRHAREAGVIITDERKHLEEFWGIVCSNLAEKHGASPVHTLSEIQLLHSMFPENIKLVFATYEEKVVAGTVLFSTKQVLHSQYFSANQEGRAIRALDVVFDHCIRRAADESIRYFDFGISNEQGGMVLNSGLYQFKTKFGCSGVVHEFYEMLLN